MSAFSVQVTYRKACPSPRMSTSSVGQARRAVSTEFVSSEVLIDYAEDGTPLGIEIISPGQVSLQEIHEAFDRIGLERPEPRDLEPLRAA